MPLREPEPKPMMTTTTAPMTMTVLTVTLVPNAAPGITPRPPRGRGDMKLIHHDPVNFQRKVINVTRAIIHDPVNLQLKVINVTGSINRHTVNIQRGVINHRELFNHLPMYIPLDVRMIVCAQLQNLPRTSSTTSPLTRSAKHAFRLR